MKPTFPLKKSFFGFCLSALTLLIPAAGQAHFLWVLLDPATGTVSVGLQEVPGQEPLPLGDKATQVRAWLPAGQAVKLKADSNWLKASTKAPCVGASLDYGVIDRNGSGRGVFWLKYYAKGATTLAASQSRLNLPVELLATKLNDDQPVITVLRDGKPAADADLTVEDGAGKVTFEGKTRADGTATLPASKGPIQVRALITENTRGTHSGKPFELIRTYSTLTVQTPSGPKPLTQLLRDSFGDDHDIVGNTSFVNTLMGGKLTKPQLEAHLQQRALINEAVDRILRAPQAPIPLPYGDQQKNVLALLRHDLKAMGSSWPAESQAWPLTRGLLKEIRDSAKKGPYFALGVFHVYFGGITHGGRDIGAKIADTLKINLSYYLKSDGYAEYAKRVNEITDPAAQKEMIRGGNAAYQYIIATSNLPVFRSGS